MNLTEGQLFTIEALNRIEGFVWPDKAEFAEVDGGRYVYFYSSDDEVHGAIYSNRVKDDDDKRVIHAQVTREQFDSVDGWVRNTNLKLPHELIDSQVEVLHHNGEIAFDDANAFYWDENVDKWRYHKPTKEAEMKDAEQFQPPIHETYYRYKKQRETTADTRKALEASMEAEDKLLEQIKAWNLEHGFDVRLLDESEEKPELVITDWRDLRVGDVIWWSGAGCIDSGEYVVSNVESSDYKGSAAFCVSCAHGLEWVSTKFEKWKFIRRPSK